MRLPLSELSRLEAKLTLPKTQLYDRFTMPKTESPADAQPAERVFLIDSMSHIFRAFYAPMANRAAPLQTSKGQVTQAIYIFTNMLRKLLQDEKPNYIAAVFESKEKTFRHEAFADYKATRLAMPEDLASQLPYIRRLCEAYSIPMITVSGFEADDVIGTLAVKAAAKGLQAVIVSNDKDMCQLVRDPWIVSMRPSGSAVSQSGLSKYFKLPLVSCGTVRRSVRQRERRTRISGRWRTATVLWRRTPASEAGSTPSVRPVT